jgi:hypothetical protein
MSLDNWRSFLAGSPHKVIVYSDHQNLLYWKEPHKISRRVAREVLRYLSTTLKSVTSKEQPMVAQTHCQEDQITIKELKTTPTWWYFPTAFLQEQR